MTTCKKHTAPAAGSWRLWRAWLLTPELPPGPARSLQQHDGAPLQEHYLHIYVGSPHFPQPCPVPEMAGIDPLQMQRERQQRARAEQERQGLLASPTASERTCAGGCRVS